MTKTTRPAADPESTEQAQASGPAELQPAGNAAAQEAFDLLEDAERNMLEIIERAHREEVAARQRQTARRAEREARELRGRMLDMALAELQEAGAEAARAELERWEASSDSERNAQREEIILRHPGDWRGTNWCGFFGEYVLQSGAEEQLATFLGRNRLASFEKARSYFLYDHYNSAEARPEEEALMYAHQEQGSVRHYWVFPGYGEWMEGTREHYYARNASRIPGTPEVVHSHEDLPLRAGDIALFRRGHVAVVEDYDPSSGILTTIEGNVSGAGVHEDSQIERRTYDLTVQERRDEFDGFGRPAAGDYGL